MNLWLLKLPSPYLELAEKNFQAAPYEGTFIWGETEEGFDFWLNILYMAFEFKSWE